jgi:hypothetical protein
LNWALTGAVSAKTEHAANTATDTFTFIVKPPIQLICISAAAPTMSVKRYQVNGAPFCLSVTGVYRGRVFIEVAMRPAQGFKPNPENFLRCKILRFERVAGEAGRCNVAVQRDSWRLRG